MRGQSPWTDVITTALIQLWSEGRSGTEIARRLNVSRNSVIGKAHRLDLPRRPSPIRYSEGERKQQTKACRHNIPRESPILPSLKPRTAILGCTPTQTPRAKLGRAPFSELIAAVGLSVILDQAASSSASNLLCRANRIAKSTPTAPT